MSIAGGGRARGRRGALRAAAELHALRARRAGHLRHAQCGAERLARVERRRLGVGDVRPGGRRDDAHFACRHAGASPLHACRLRGRLQRGAHQARGVAGRRDRAARRPRRRLERHLRRVRHERNGKGAVHLRQHQQGRLHAGGGIAHVQLDRDGRDGDAARLRGLGRGERTAVQDVLDGGAVERARDQPLRQVREALRSALDHHAGIRHAHEDVGRVPGGRIERGGARRLFRPLRRHAFGLRAGQRPVHPRVLRLRLVQRAEAHPGGRGRRAGHHRHDRLHRRGDQAPWHGVRHEGPLAAADRKQRQHDRRRIRSLLLPATGPSSAASTPAPGTPTRCRCWSPATA